MDASLTLILAGLLSILFAELYRPWNKPNPHARDDFARFWGFESWRWAAVLMSFRRFACEPLTPAPGALPNRLSAVFQPLCQRTWHVRTWTCLDLTGAEVRRYRCCYSSTEPTQPHGGLAAVKRSPGERVRGGVHGERKPRTHREREIGLVGQHDQDHVVSPWVRGEHPAQQPGPSRESHASEMRERTDPHRMNALVRKNDGFRKLRMVDDEALPPADDPWGGASENACDGGDAPQSCR